MTGHAGHGLLGTSCRCREPGGLQPGSYLNLGICVRWAQTTGIGNP